QEDAREVAGTDWQDQGLVFTTGVGTPLDGRNVARRLDRLLAEANLPHHTFHELRHSCASLLLALGVQPRVVMQTLGHTQIATSMEIYTHVSAALEREAADRMDAFLRRGRA
ncbi:MAG: tyrosine-type recombinase/integrase, partial [Chloroflexi bacterium]|nr:tyrosine-type recombinase/integrase [Chloroflexota bacterium]